MESTFSVYLRLGFEHIADLGGYDHLLFVIALVAIYPLDQWKHLLVLVTAFTVGHSVTLALATLHLVSVDTGLVEFLIPLTIILASAVNIFEVRTGITSQDPTRVTTGWRLKYGLALVFGLIHGLGFSNFLRALLGEETSLLIPLFSFNVGLELGQFLILSVTLLVSAGICRYTPLTRRNWAILLSVMTGGLALAMIL